MIREYMKKDEGKNWNMAYRTPIKDYAVRINLSKILKEKIKRLKPGEKLRVLDVGMGDGSQWGEFLLDPKIREKIELHATTLKKIGLTPTGLEGRVKTITAALLHRRFQPNYFDVVVSHYGMHRQEFAGVESVHHILKPGGEAILTFEKSTLTGIHSNRWIDFKAPKFYKIIKEKKNRYKHTIWFRKH